MLNFTMNRKGWMAAGLVSAAAAVFTLGGFGTAEDAPKPDAETAIALAQPTQESPLNHPVASFTPKGWEEIQEPVLVQFSQLKTEGGLFSTEVTLLNRGEVTLKGPVRLVLDEIGLAEATLKNGNGKLSNDAPYVDLLAKGRSLAGTKTTKGRKLTLAAKPAPTAEQLARFEPQYRVLVPTDPGKKSPSQATEFTQAELDAAMKSQNALDAELQKTGYKDVFGTATSLDENGKLYLSVYSRISNPSGVPATKDGLPVKVELKGPFYPQYEDKLDARATSVNPDAFLTRPIPIGVSIRNESACGFVGTLSCRTTGRGSKWVMSNYHVMVPTSNIRAVKIYQPACSTNATNQIGTLGLYYPITFTTSASNTYDASWATTTTALVGTRPPEGYSTLGSTKAPQLGALVQKYGRTTKYTQGKITSVNATFNINYSQGTARFVNQVVINPTAGYSVFSSPGDSGSLIVTQGTNQPVALLFAGGGTTTVANPIPGLLSGAGMTVDQ